MNEQPVGSGVRSEENRQALADSVRILSLTIILIHAVFVLVDWAVDPEFFRVLLSIKVVLVLILSSIIAITYLWPTKIQYEMLILVVLAALLGSTFLHSELLGESMFIPLTAVVCATFSASFIPWQFRWHTAVLMVCIFAILLNHWLVGTGPVWPVTKTLILSIILCLTSVLLMRFSKERRNELALATLKLKRSERQARKLAEKLQRLANTDYLTGAGNLRGFHEYAEQCFEQNANPVMWLVLMDLDHFKSVNDSYGHATGDKVLKKFVSLCRKTFAVPCHLCRVGGEEFAVLLSDINEAQVLEQSEELRKVTSNKAIKTSEESQSKRLRVTVSVGVSQVSEGEADIKKAIRRADQALYHAKRTGRNKVVLWTPDLGSVDNSLPPLLETKNTPIKA